MDGRCFIERAAGDFEVNNQNEFLSELQGIKIGVRKLKFGGS
jgi:hypothetical protein